MKNKSWSFGDMRLEKTEKGVIKLYACLIIYLLIAITQHRPTENGQSGVSQLYNLEIKLCVKEFVFKTI